MVVAMDYDQFYKNLGKRIKYLRENLGLSQEKLAEKAGISLDFLGKIEVCINKPGIRSILKIANALNVSVSELTNFDK